LAAVTDYLSSHFRPIAFRAPFGRSMLVVAPHQEDEVVSFDSSLFEFERRKPLLWLSCSTAQMDMTN